MDAYNIMAVVIDHRSENSVGAQKVFAKYGCIIKVRLGLHETEDKCLDTGLIVLELAGNKDEIKKFEAELNEVEGVKAQNMEVTYKL